MSVVECKGYVEFIAHLPHGSVDLLLTDPPYAISQKGVDFRLPMTHIAWRMDFQLGKWRHKC